MSSKRASLRRRHAAVLRRLKRQHKRGTVPQHTATERKRQERERRAEREAGLRRIRQIRRGTGIAFSAVAASIMAGVLSLSPASAAGPPRAALHDYYRAYMTGQAQAARADRGEMPHDDGPDITQDDPFTPYIVTGAPGYRLARVIPLAAPPSRSYRLESGRLDELPHNEIPPSTLYPGGPSYGGTAPTLAGLAEPRPAGSRPSWDSPRYGPWGYYRMPSGS